MAPELAILVGLPGAGKSSFYRAHLAATHVHVSKDLLPRSADKGRRQESLVEAALAAGRSVAVDNTNPRREDRAPLVAQARRHGARVTVYVFPPDVGGSLARNRARGEGRVPDVAIFTAARRLELPSSSEGFDAVRRVELVPPDAVRVEDWPVGPPR